MSRGAGNSVDSDSFTVPAPSDDSRPVRTDPSFLFVTSGRELNKVDLRNYFKHRILWKALPSILYIDAMAFVLWRESCLLIASFDGDLEIVPCSPCPTPSVAPAPSLVNVL